MCPVSVPVSRVESITDVLHGVPVTDPYRWLEDQDSPETKAWIEEQVRYARAYFDSIGGRTRIRERVGELLDVETYDSFLKAGNRYFFRKRLRGQEQPCIYFRDGAGDKDQLLIDPATRGTGDYTAVKPLRVSPSGSLLLYEVKQGGESTGTFEILDAPNRKRLPDVLPHGYLRGFAFAPDSSGFYYAHEATPEDTAVRWTVYYHALGRSFEQDREILRAVEDQAVRMAMASGPRQLGFVTCRFGAKTLTSFEIWGMGSARQSVPVLRNAEYLFAPRFLDGRILALTDKDAPNRRIVEVQPTKQCEPYFFTLVPETKALIRDWVVTANYILVTYTLATKTWVEVSDLFGHRLGQIPTAEADTVRVAASDIADNEVLLEYQSFTKPPELFLYSIPSGKSSAWSDRAVPFDPTPYAHKQVCFTSRDGTSVPMFLVGRKERLAVDAHPLVMTSYGGYGVSMTPQFSVLVACLLERGCLFALPNIRGGSEFGVQWHHAARRRNRQVAFDDFLSAAEWLVGTGKTSAEKLAIFGGSNSGLLVGAALTQRPDLFCAVLCMVPVLDMLRYHLFDCAYLWKDEFGTADDADDFRALASYSPYHAIRNGCAYPGTMLVSGNSDQNCNPLHARKMIARLQAANSSPHPILLDYSPNRGHSPVLPLTERVDALADRLAFLCDQLRLAE